MGDRGEKIDSRSILVIYCDRPESLSERTGLGSKIGNDVAEQFYTLCIDLLQKELPGLATMFEVVISPFRKSDVEWVRFSFPDCERVLPQRSGGLGDRVFSSLADLCVDGSKNVLFTMVDQPSLPRHYLSVADHLLREKDVVLGPTSAGGLYTIATRAPLPGLRGASWETGDAFTQLARTLARSDIALGIAPPWYHVDSTNNFNRAGEDLRKSPSLARQQFGLWIDSVLTKSATFAYPGEE